MAIEELRRLGYSYRDIAEKMNISVNTVKSYCRRNNLTKAREKDKADICLQCQKPISHTEHKKKKKFCSDSCRLKWWGGHRELINRKSKISIKCKGCGREFKAYEKDNRKYCSHSCYIKARFK